MTIDDPDAELSAQDVVDPLAKGIEMSRMEGSRKLSKHVVTNFR